MESDRGTQSHKTRTHVASEYAGRWGVALFAVWGAFIAGALLGCFGVTAAASGLSGAGFTAAFAVVGVAYVAAPAARLPFAAAMFVLGAAAAWSLLCPAPQGRDALLHEATWGPLIWTYTGGLLAFALCGVVHRLQGRNRLDAMGNRTDRPTGAR